MLTNLLRAALQSYPRVLACIVLVCSLGVALSEIMAAPPAPLRSGSLTKSLPSLIRVEPKPTGPPVIAEQSQSLVPEAFPSQNALIPGEAQPTPEVPSFIVKGEGERGQSADRVTFKLNKPLLEISAGDLDADGRPEIVGITDSEVIVYRWLDRQMMPIASIESDPFVHLLHLDVGDVNGSGHAQVFVTAMSIVSERVRFRNLLTSYVLELRGGKLVYVATRLRYFLRLLTIPTVNTPILIGQRMGQYVPFEGPIFRLNWNGQRYVEGEILNVPTPVNSLYDFAPIETAGNQILEMAVLNDQRRMTIYGRGGKLPWVASDDMGEVNHLAFPQTPLAPIFYYGLLSGGPEHPGEVSVLRVLPRRFLVEVPPLLGHAKVELLVPANTTTYGFQISLFSNEPSFGGVAAYDRNGGTFTKSWETIPVEGKVHDIAAADLEGTGRKDLIVLSAVKEKGFVASLKSEVRAIMNVFSFAR